MKQIPLDVRVDDDVDTIIGVEDGQGLLLFSIDPEWIGQLGRMFLLEGDFVMSESDQLIESFEL